MNRRFLGSSANFRGVWPQAGMPPQFTIEIFLHRKIDLLIALRFGLAGDIRNTICLCASDIFKELSFQGTGRDSHDLPRGQFGSAFT